MARIFLMGRAAGLLACTMWLSACTHLFFHPLSTQVRTPDAIGLAYEDAWFKTQDDLRLHGWFLPAESKPCATILFLHGNAENISTHIASVYWLPPRGFNVFLPDYRGYGLSEGSPSLPGLQLDIEAAMRYLLARPDVDPGAIVIFGQSLGGAAAIYYAAHNAHRAQLRAVVAESTIASYRGITREKLAGFWLTWPFQALFDKTVSDDYSPLPAVPNVAPLPLLLVHGDRDPIVPIEHGERLYTAANEPKEFWRIEGGGHIEAFRSEAWRERLVSYLRAHACPGESDSKR